MARMRFAGFVCALAGLAAAVPATAQPVTVVRQSVVVGFETGDFQLGEILDLSYTFETSSIDVNPAPDQGTYSNSVAGLVANFRSSGHRFTFGGSTDGVFNSASTMDDFAAGEELNDILTFASSSPQQVVPVNGTTPAIMQISFTDFRIFGSPNMLTGDSVPVSAFPFSFAVVQLWDPSFQTLASSSRRRC